MDYDELYHRLGVLEFNINLYSASLRALETEKMEIIEIISKSITNGNDTAMHTDSKFMGNQEGGEKSS